MTTKTKSNPEQNNNNTHIHTHQQEPTPPPVAFCCGTESEYLFTSSRGKPYYQCRQCRRYHTKNEE